MGHREELAGFFRGFRALPKGELHLHLEGGISAGTLVRLSRLRPEPLFPDLARVRERLRFSDKDGFLGLYRDVCRQLRRPEDYAEVARDVCRRLRREGTRYAEVFVSPAIVEKVGLSWPAVREELEGVFAAHERRGYGRVLVLLDAVRQWGPDLAHHVLDLHVQRPWPRVRGFGLGGDEGSIPARDFAGVYRRVRRLGLAPLVHAGEWGGPDSVAAALDHLRPVRIGHGIRAVEDPAVVRLLVRRQVVLDVCPTSNAATGALPAGGAHPALALLRAGVPITLGTDDPGLFRTTLRREYRALAGLGATGRELRAVAALSRSAALGRR